MAVNALKNENNLWTKQVVIKNSYKEIFRYLDRFLNILYIFNCPLSNK